MVRIVAPVVVKPDTDSKMASAKLGITPEIHNGIAPKIPAAIHAAATNIIPPETESLTFLFLKKKKKTAATAKTKAVGIKKDGIK